MTEKSKMLATSFFTRVESRIVGSGPANERSKWLLHEALHVQCFLGERSIWKWTKKPQVKGCLRNLELT